MRISDWSSDGCSSDLHCAGVARYKQGQAGQADQYQQGDKAAIHRLLRRHCMIGVALDVEPKQAGWTDQQPDAAHCAKQHGDTEHRIRRLVVQQIVVQRGDGGGDKTECEDGELQVMEYETPNRESEM